MSTTSTHSAKKKALAPKLRFKGFSGEWEIKKLGDVITNKSSKYNPEKDRESYNCIELEHLSSNTSLLLGYTNSIGSASIKNKFQKGDVLFGKLRPYLRKFLLAPFDGVCSSEIWVLKGEGISNQFLFSTIQTEYFIDLANQSTGSKMPRADWNVVSSGMFHIPTLPEQQKIATFLSAIDEKIQQLTRKKELLEQYKKGVMQKLFPPAGGQAPKLRFKDENGKAYPKWEEKRLWEIDIYISDGNYGGLYPKASEMKKGGVPFIRANNIKNLNLVWDDMKYIDEELHSVLTSGHLKTHDILITTRGDIGMVAIVSEDFNGANINAQICLLRCGKNINSNYLLQFLGSKKGKKQFKELQTGSALKQLPRSSLETVKVNLPSNEEQQKIASYFSSLDTKIESVATQITQSQTFKKGLLQQMFV